MDDYSKQLSVLTITCFTLAAILTATIFTHTNTTLTVFSLEGLVITTNITFILFYLAFLIKQPYYNLNLSNIITKQFNPIQNK